MPGLGRFARGKPQTPSGVPAAAPTTEMTPEAMPEDEGNWMQFDVPEMDLDNFGGNDDAASFGFLDTTAHPDEEEEEQQQQEQVLPPAADARIPASASKGLALSMFKNKTSNNLTTTTDNAGDAAVQATSVPDATATDFQNLDRDPSGSHQDTPMAESHDSSLSISNTAGAGESTAISLGEPGLPMFDSAARNAPAQATLRQQGPTNQGNENSARSGFSLLARATTQRNVTNNSNLNTPITGGIENSLEGNPPSNARTVPNFTTRATEGASSKVLPAMRASPLPRSSSTSTRILPLPAKVAPPPVLANNKQSQQGVIPRFTNRTPQGQATRTPQQPRVARQNLAKNPHRTQASRPVALQTPANSSGNKRGLLKQAPPAVTPSPSNRSNPMGDMTTVLPPSKPRASPNQRNGTIVPPPAPPTTTPAAATANSSPPPSPQEDSSPDFNELHAKFLSDIRDLEDTQNANGDRLISMESNLAIAYSVLLQDQFQFLHLLEKLEDITKETDQVIAKYQESA